MVGYVKCFDGSKTMSFIADDKKLLKMYIKIWEKLNSLISKKTKIKSYGDKMITNFGAGNSKKVPKEGLPYKCLALIMSDSVIKTGKKYYPQTLLEECKYKITKKKKWEILLMMILIQVANRIANLVMNPVVNLIMNLVVNLIAKLINK